MNGQIDREYRARVEGAAEWISERVSHAPPTAGLVLGTGLGALVAEIEDSTQIPYGEIPGFLVSTAPGHSGTLHHGRVGDRWILAMEGRFHLYEGYSLTEVTLPVRVLGRLGVRDLIVSNAAGGMSRRFEKGDLMVIDDHINMMGGNPLIGPNVDEWGPRFPDMLEPYDRRHVEKLLAIAREHGIRAHAGVYVGLPGPCLETRAEYRLLAQLGADAVGMSTVPEVIVGVHEGMRIAALSVITDLCFPDDLEPVSVEEILQVAAEAEPKLTKVVIGLLQNLEDGGGAK